MLPLRLRPIFLAASVFAACFVLTSSSLAQPNANAPILSVEGLGKGAVPVNGQWQFHLGDNPAWASPSTADNDRSAGWEQITTDKPWGTQGHPAYAGFAWYRKHLRLTLAPGAPADLAMLITQVDNVYEIYWNGTLVGRFGHMPPDPQYPYSPPDQTFGLGPIRDGVLAVRVWKSPLMSFEPNEIGGFYSPPLIGSPAAIATVKASEDYKWLRSRQYSFGLQALNAIVMVLSLLLWFRDRSQRVLLAMAAFSGSPVLALVLVGLRIPFSFFFALGWLQPVLSIADIGLWYLLLYLLKLDENPRLTRFTHALAIASFAATSLDGILSALDWSNPVLTSWVQGADGILTAIFTVAEIYPLVLVAFALRKRLDSARWLVAITACMTGMLSVIRIAVQQGSRYTHWTFGEKIGAPLFNIYGNVFTAQILAETLLLIAIVYAVYRYIQETARQHSTMEQEFRSARELQQVLIPEKLPELPGFAFTTAYRPAQEVGGDFFQIIPLEGEQAGSTLILLGDVSGKGLKAAMTVSLIVGATRALAKFVHRPAEILTELNQRLVGRLNSGFVTCLAMRLDSDGHCVVATAGHPAPYLNKTELDLPGALPLGVLATATYEEAAVDLHEGDHFALYTDGLLEARGANGEIFSFERLNELFATRPDATKATEAAVDFGQEDDITVLTLTRLAPLEQASTRYSAPQFLSV
jgi:Stage II sporulation protein E (SpoIIE)